MPLGYGHMEEVKGEQGFIQEFLVGGKGCVSAGNFCKATPTFMKPCP